MVWNVISQIKSHFFQIGDEEREGPDGGEASMVWSGEGKDVAMVWHGEGKDVAMVGDTSIAVG
jgi:hypothetical protein